LFKRSKRIWFKSSRRFNRCAQFKSFRTGTSVKDSRSRFVYSLRTRAALGSKFGVKSLQAVEKLTVTKKIDPGSFVV
jgi:hypothetical protein